MTPSPAAPGLLLSRRPAPRRLLAWLLLAVLLISVATTAASADEIIENESYIYYVGGIITSTVTEVGDPGGSGTYEIGMLGCRYPHTLNPGALVYAPYKKITCTNKSIFYDEKPFTINYGGKIVATGQRTVYISPDVPGNDYGNDYIAWTFDTWDWSGISVTTATLNPTILWGNSPSYTLKGSGSTVSVAGYPDQQIWCGDKSYIKHAKYTYNAVDTWTNKVSAIKIGESVILSVEKTIDDITSISKVSIRSLIKSQPYYVGAIDPDDVSISVSLNDAPYEISVYSPVNGKWYNRTAFQSDSVDPGDPGDSSRVMVHIIAQDARTENLLLDAAVEVRDQNDAVVATGTTSPNGWLAFEYDLPATLADEDFQRYYTVNITLPGWTQKVTNYKFYPAFIPRSGDWIRVEMLPDTDGPADPEKTYIMFFVRDIHSNPLERASIEIAGNFWHTNSAGHVAVEVPKNSTTAYTVRKTGHVSISGSAAVGAEGSYVVNIALGPALPDRTPGPGDDPGATPPPRDTRTNEEKGKAVIDLIADNAELIATLAILAAVMGLINLIMPGRRRR